MADAAPVAPAAAPVAPTNGAHPTTPQKPAETKQPVAAKPPEVDDSEEYTVDGKTVRLTKEQRKLQFQKALAADKRLKEAADIRNKDAAFWRKFESDPEAAIRERGFDPDKVFGSHLERKAKDALLTEEQRKFQQLERERDDARKEAESLKGKEKAERQKAIDAQTFGEYEKGLVAAADKHGLGDDAGILEALADIGLEYLDLEIPLTPDQIVQEYMRREHEHVEQKDKKLHSVLKGEKLLKYLGDATLGEIQAALKARDAASLGGIPKPQAKPKIPVRAHERTPSTPNGYIDEKTFDARHGRK